MAFQVSPWRRRRWMRVDRLSVVQNRTISGSVTSTAIQASAVLIGLSLQLLTVALPTVSEHQKPWLQPIATGVTESDSVSIPVVRTSSAFAVSGTASPKAAVVVGHIYVPTSHWSATRFR